MNRQYLHLADNIFQHLWQCTQCNLLWQKIRLLQLCSDYAMQMFSLDSFILWNDGSSMKYLFFYVAFYLLMSVFKICCFSVAQSFFVNRDFLFSLSDWTSLSCSVSSGSYTGSWQANCVIQMSDPSENEGARLAVSRLLSSMAFESRKWCCVSRHCFPQIREIQW